MRKLFTIVYFIILIAIAVVGLAIGAANDLPVNINLLFINLSVNLATVIAGAVCFGGVYVALLMLYVVIKQKCKIIYLHNKIKNLEADNINILKTQSADILHTTKSSNITDDQGDVK